MKNLLIIIGILFLLVGGCKDCTEVETVAGPLEGVWELVSAAWKMEDSTLIIPSPGINLKSMKYFSKEHFFVIGKDSPTAENYALAGTYSVEGQEYTEMIQFNSFGNPGDGLKIKFSVEGDLLTLKSDWFTETWKRIE